MRYLLVLLLAGCATEWVQEGATEKDFRMADGQCNAQALSANVGGFTRMSIYEYCMQGKGWQRK